MLSFVRPNPGRKWLFSTDRHLKKKMKKKKRNPGGGRRQLRHENHSLCCANLRGNVVLNLSMNHTRFLYHPAFWHSLPLSDYPARTTSPSAAPEFPGLAHPHWPPCPHSARVDASGKKSLQRTARSPRRGYPRSTVFGRRSLRNCPPAPAEGLRRCPHQIPASWEVA